MTLSDSSRSLNSVIYLVIVVIVTVCSQFGFDSSQTATTDHSSNYGCNDRRAARSA